MSLKGFNQTIHVLCNAETCEKTAKDFHDEIWFGEELKVDDNQINSKTPGFWNSLSTKLKKRTKGRTAGAMKLWVEIFKLKNLGEVDVPKGVDLLIYAEFSRLLHHDLIAKLFIDRANDPLKLSAASVTCKQYSDFYYRVFDILNDMTLIA